MNNPQPNELLFSIEKIRPLIEHALAASAWRPTYGQRLSETKVGPGLWLVHDEGIYLMSNGDPGLHVDGTTNHQVVYAEGFDPTNPDYWSDSVAAVGGDDFTEFIGAENIQRALTPKAAYLSITVEEEELSFIVYSKKD